MKRFLIRFIRSLIRSAISVWWLTPRKLRNVWIISDRRDSGGDNGEHVFRFICDNYPEVNAWYAISSNASDWNRLVREGYRRRLTDHGSMWWRLQLAVAEVEMSSHTILPAVEWRSPDTVRVLLTHGVLHNDIAPYRAGSAQSSVVTTTAAEDAYLRANARRYAVDQHSILHVGMPRLDRLELLDQEVLENQRDTILLAPTWRKDISHSRELFVSSRYYFAWSSLVQDARLHELAYSADLRLIILPHPNAGLLFEAVGLNSPVTAVAHGETDIQRLIARSRVLITDYSSVAFDAAFIGRPTIYFQFDKDRIFNGHEHTISKGYFDYERDGFGPVVEKVDDVVEEINELIARDFEPLPDYESRMRETFPLSRGKNCLHLFEAVTDIVASERR